MIFLGRSSPDGIARCNTLSICSYRSRKLHKYLLSQSTPHLSTRRFIVRKVSYEWSRYQKPSTRIADSKRPTSCLYSYRQLICLGSSCMSFLNIETYCGQHLIIFIFKLQMNPFGGQSRRAEFAEHGLDTSWTSRATGKWHFTQTQASAHYKTSFQPSNSYGGLGTYRL